MSEDVKNVLISLVGNAIWLILGLCLRFISNAGWTHYRTYFFIGFVALLLAAYPVSQYVEGTVAKLAIMAATALGVTTFGLARHLYKLWAAGIESADLSMKEGTTAAKSLSLVSHGLDFLGVGASKLTAEKEFEAMAQRCTQGGGIRILLSDPRSPALKQFARQADKREGAYVKKVVDSLKILKHLKEQRNFKIEVRFYSPTITPPFRMFFVDENLCLVSPYVFGIGDGSDLPQVFVARRKQAGTFYKGFSEYFNSMWRNSTIWDFQIKKEWESCEPQK
jgi:hypothetical protein